MSLVKANTYQDASGGSNAVFSGVASPPGSMGFRNRLINSNMVIDQRNAGAAVTTDGAFPVDRWKQNMSGGGVISGQRSTVVPAGFTNSLGLTVSTADSSIAASDYYLTQNIEGFNVGDLGWGTASAQTITVSFQVRSSVTGTYAVAFGNSAFNRLYVATYTVNSANTYETKTVTIPGDTSGTWLTDNGIGLRVYFDLGSGSNYNASSSGSWLGSGVGIRTSGTVNWIATSGATFYITGVQLEAGSVASPFERRDYGRELMMCQRYLPAFSADAVSYRLPGAGICSSSTQTYCTIIFPQTTRVPATGVTVSSGSHFTVDVDGLVAPTSTSVSFSSLSSLNAARISVTVAAGLTLGQPMFLTINNSSGRILFTGCEL
jgi:hypothetical protein